jgi:MFS family permease
MLLDLSPLSRHRDFRLVFFGQLVSAFGSFMTYVALPVQTYQLTRSSAVVGLLGAVELVPLALTALWGGALADALDRRRMLLWCEALLMLGSLALVVNALLPHPSVGVLFIVAAFHSAVNGFHSPSLTSLTPRLVPPEDLPAISTLNSLRGTVAAIAGPALAGVCIATLGLAFTFGADAATFGASLLALAAIRSMPPAKDAPPAGLASIREGVAYALRRPELVGTYVVDIVAIAFATPMAVLPALADRYGGAHAIAYLYSAISVGALLTTIFSRWTRHVVRHGAAVALGAGVWGLGIVALGFAPSLPLAVLCLVIAGAGDGVSVIFRSRIWNETIPPEIRGRMASIEQLSYMTGPLVGNVRAGFLAEALGLARSISWGGAACLAGIFLCVQLLPRFWRYREAEAGASDAGGSGGL